MRTMQKPCSPRSSWRLRPEGAPSTVGLLPGAPGGFEPSCPSVPPGCCPPGGGPCASSCRGDGSGVDDGERGVSQGPGIVNYDNIMVSQCVIFLLKSYARSVAELVMRAFGEAPAGVSLSRALSSRHPELAAAGTGAHPPSTPAGALCASRSVACSCRSGRILMCRRCRDVGAFGGRREGPELASLCAGPALPRLRTQGSLGRGRGPAWMREALRGPRDRKTRKSHSCTVLSSLPSCVSQEEPLIFQRKERNVHKQKATSWEKLPSIGWPGLGGRAAKGVT